MFEVGEGERAAQALVPCMKVIEIPVGISMKLTRTLCMPPS
jgi:hypothetical protein